MVRRTSLTALLALIILALIIPTTSAQLPDTKIGDWVISGTETSNGENILILGDIKVLAGGHFTVKSSTITFNEPNPGSNYGIYVEQGGTIELDGATIGPRTYDDTEGTRIYFEIRGTADIKDSTLSGLGGNLIVDSGSAQVGPGGVNVLDSGTLTITDTDILDPLTGGICIENAGSATIKDVTIERDEMSDNSISFFYGVWGLRSTGTTTIEGGSITGARYSCISLYQTRGRIEGVTFSGCGNEDIRIQNKEDLSGEIDPVDVWVESNTYDRATINVYRYGSEGEWTVLANHSLEDSDERLNDYRGALHEGTHYALYKPTGDYTTMLYHKISFEVVHMVQLKVDIEGVSPSQISSVTLLGIGDNTTDQMDTINGSFVFREGLKVDEDGYLELRFLPHYRQFGWGEMVGLISYSFDHDYEKYQMNVTTGSGDVHTTTFKIPGDGRYTISFDDDGDGGSGLGTGLAPLCVLGMTLALMVSTRRRQ